MARYFLNLHECGNVVTDDEGIERSSLAEVHQGAFAAAREIMCAELAHGRLCLSCHIEVQDEAGAVVMTVPFKDAVTITG
jgi:antirestriction protein ArdC